MGNAKIIWRRISGGKSFGGPGLNDVAGNTKLLQQDILVCLGIV